MSKANPQYVRQQFQYNGVLNVIPPGRISQAASIMLNKYTPQPNTMDMGGMTMMGQPTVVGAGNDANNYLDARKERMFNDQGTVRIDHNFANGDTRLLPLLGRRRAWLHPRRACPASASITTTFRSRVILAWNHIFNSHLVNEASRHHLAPGHDAFH